MQSLENKITSIAEKTQLLLQQYVHLEEQNLYLSEQVKKMKRELEQKNTIINEFENKLKTLQIAKSVEVDEDRSALKQKINEYIREIDKCIALLND